MTPEWNSAFSYTTPHSIIHEIPMSNIGVSGAFILDKSAEQLDISEKLEVRSYLVVEKFLEKETPRIFVSTSFGTYSGDETEKEAALSYYGSKAGFTGYLIISDSEGQYLASYKFNNGTKERMMMGIDPGEQTSEVYTGIIFEKATDMKTRSDDEPMCNYCGIPLRSNGTCWICDPDIAAITVYAYRPNIPMAEDDSYWDYDPGGGEDEWGGDREGGGGGTYPSNPYQKSALEASNKLKAALTNLSTIPMNKIHVTINTTLNNPGEVVTGVNTTRSLYDKNVIPAIHLRPGLTDAQIKLIMAHEYMHLKVFDISRNVGVYASSGDIDYIKSAQALHNANPELASNLSQYYPDINGAHHEYMGNHVAEMEQLLRQAFPGESNDFYRYGKWGGGAYNSTAFRNLPYAEQSAVQDYLRKQGLYK